MDSQAQETIRLTQFSHGGGCGCKIAPKLLAELLAGSGVNGLFPNLQALIATTDFFMPIVDDAFDFGRIAATNAISDVYAMGGTPILALAIVGMPINKLPVATMQQILAGGASVCQAAGIPIAGGHSIDSPEPIYGLVALGLVHPDRVQRNSSAQAGDVLILGKALGVGILSAALKKGELSEAGYAEMIATTTQLNSVGATLATMPGIHAITDVTGFGLLGHTLEMCRGAGLTATLQADSLPVLEHALPFARAGYGPGAIERNWTSFGESVNVAAEVPDWQVRLMLDPQTSGGLLVACAPDAVTAVLAVMQVQGYAAARIIGRLAEGDPAIHVTP